ncbi:MAG: thioesterase family protein [Pseudonocardiaceae bacterium]|nr:thioesterase family protein [Pseudonocardiaceae bacterium]
MSTEPEPATSFGVASTPRSLGDGTYTTTLRPEWAVGSKPHGGFLLALLARTALALLGEKGDRSAEPLTVSAQFLRAPEFGPVLLRTDVRKIGRQAAVIAVLLEQRGRSCVEGVVTTGRLPTQRPEWSDVPAMPVAPPADAVDFSAHKMLAVSNLTTGCEIYLDRAGAGFLERKTDQPPRLRLWTRPRDEQPDPLFALIAGDISVPVTFNLGRIGWSPTLQMTALLRARPVPGWLRVEVSARSVHGPWFDEDATVVDSAGQLVCQARQLALTSS